MGSRVVRKFVRSSQFLSSKKFLRLRKCHLLCSPGLQVQNDNARKETVHGRIYSQNYSTVANVTEEEENLWVKSPHPDIEVVSRQTIPEFLWEKTLQWGNLPAFECGVTGQIQTYTTLYQNSRSFAASLIKSGANRGEVIAIILPNIPEFPIVILGSMDAGLVVTTLNPGYTPHELSRQLINCEAKWVVTNTQFLPSVLKTKKLCPGLSSVVVIGSDMVPQGCLSYFDMIKTNPADFQNVFLRGSDIDPTTTTAFLPYSSGTTGSPKGVCLTHTNLATNVRQRVQPGVGSSMTPAESGGVQEKFLGILPFYHIAGFNLYNLMSIHQGAHTFCIPKFEPSAFVRALKSHRPTILHLVPPIISFMCDSKEIGPEELKSIHTITGGAAPISPYQIKRLLGKAGKFIFFAEAYGMSESSPITHQLSPSKENDRIGSCGTPIPNTTCKVIDLVTGQSLGSNKRGELCARGPQVMKGYFKNEKATAETVDSKGWLHTGDIAYYDEEGYFYIVDRLKELIKVKGFQVPPSELEDLLREHKDVVDVAVIGIPNPDSGELPRAYIVTRNKDLTKDEIHEFVKDKVIAYKRLKGGIEFVDVIPKAPSGKILRRLIVDEYKTTHGL